MTREEFVLQVYLAAIRSSKQISDTRIAVHEAEAFFDRTCKKEPQSFWRTFETPPTFDDELDGYVLFKPCDLHKDEHPVELFRYNAFDESLNCPDCRWAPIPK